MTVREFIKEAKGYYTFSKIEVYRFRGEMRIFHTDFIENIDEYYNKNSYMDCEVESYQLMDEEDYNNSILANACFSEEFEENEKRLIICISWRYRYDDTKKRFIFE